MPAVGESFGKTDLPKISGRMYSRLSQIYGIPVKELTPIHIYTGRSPGYKPAYHEVDPGLWSKEHEVLHSLQWLLQKEPRTKFRRSIEKFDHKEKKKFPSKKLFIC